MREGHESGSPAPSTRQPLLRHCARLPEGSGSFSLVLKSTICSESVLSPSVRPQPPTPASQAAQTLLPVCPPCLHSPPPPTTPPCHLERLQPPVPVSIWWSQASRRTPDLWPRDNCSPKPRFRGLIRHVGPAAVFEAMTWLIILGGVWAGPTTPWWPPALQAEWTRRWAWRHLPP